MPNNLFIGKSFELLVAQKLTEKGVLVSIPLIDTGADLLACNEKFAKITAIQVKRKEREQNIFFTGNEINKYKGRNLYIAYYLKDSSWFMPFDDVFIKKATFPSRRDNAGFITIGDKKTHDELLQYKDDAGFDKLVLHILR